LKLTTIYRIEIKYFQVIKKLMYPGIKGIGPTD